MQNRLEKYLDDRIKSTLVKIKSNEMVFFYMNNELIREEAAEGDLLFCYDKTKGDFRVERVYLPK